MTMILSNDNRRYKGINVIEAAYTLDKDESWYHATHSKM